MSSLVTEPKDMLPYRSLMLLELKQVLVDPILELCVIASINLGSLINGMGEDNFSDLFPWLMETLKSNDSNGL
jgi:hypothetical protein